MTFLSRIRVSGNWLTACFVCLSLCLASCHDDDEPETKQYANTVFIYMPWTGSETSSYGSLSSYFHTNLNDIETAIKNGNGNSNARTIVFLADSAGRASLFEINADGTETAIDSYSIGAMTTTSELVTLLNRVYNLTATPSYSILIGSHGSGWLPAGSQPVYSRAFGGQTRGMQTEITTLAEAIAQSRIGKMQYICFDDCYMANIETAYALRNATDYLVGSTSEVMAAGMPYQQIWQYLSATAPGYSGIVSEFGNFYSSYSSPYGELSAIDCSKTEEIASLMRAFNQNYQITDAALSTVQTLDGYRNHVFFDMADYLKKAAGADSTASATTQLLNSLQSLVPYKTCTPSLYTEYQGGFSFTVRTCSGITISDPTTNSSAVDAKTYTEWWTATH